MTLPRQAPARAPQRKAPAAPERPDLRVVPEKRDGLRPARVGTIAGALLFLALFALAAFQTVLIRAQDRLDDLHGDVAEQTELDEQLTLQLADLQSPERIAQVARDRLGMIAPHTVTFLDPRADDDQKATYDPSAAPTTTVPKTTAPTTTAPTTTVPTTTAPKSAKATKTTTAGSGTEATTANR
jgi:cell division protein FtsB